MISITFVKAHKERGHGTYFICQIFNLNGHSGEIVFRNDTNIVHLDNRKNHSVKETHYSLHKSI